MYNPCLSLAFLCVYLLRIQNFKNAALTRWLDLNPLIIHIFLMSLVNLKTKGAEIQGHQLLLKHQVAFKKSHFKMIYLQPFSFEFYFIKRK